MVVNILMNVPSTVTIKVFFRHVKNSVFVRIYFTVSSCGLLGQKYISPAVTFDPLLMAFEKILRHGTIQIKPNMVITIYATTVNTFSDLDFGVPLNLILLPPYHQILLPSVFLDTAFAPTINMKETTELNNPSAVAKEKLA